LGGLWRDREFRTFWSAQTVSEFGDRITELALPLIAVTLLEATPTEVGLLTAAVWAPNLVSLFIGTWVEERRNKRGLMIGADLFRLVVLLSLPLAYWLGLLTLWQLYAIALLAGTAHVVFNTAYAAFFVRLVRPQDYLEANSKLSATRSLSFMGGPAVGGILIQLISAPVTIVVDALSFLVSAIQIGRLRIAQGAIRPLEEPLLKRALGGMRYLFANPYLAASLGCATTVNFFNLMGSALLILFASRYLELSAGVIGMALGVGATGGLLGAIFAGRLARAIGVGRLIAIAIVFFTAPMALIALAGGPAWLKAVELAVAEFVAAFAVMCFDVPLGALQASVIEDRLRSRVSGAFLSINYGVRPFGAIAGGLLGDWLGPRETLLLSSFGGLLAMLWLLRSPILKVRSIAELQREQAAAS
jgi:MFS family permease